jgi:hypothetical protein
MKTLMSPAMLLRFLSDDPRLKLIVTWLSCLVAAISGATAIQLGVEARYVVPISAILMMGIFVALGVARVRRKIRLSGERSSFRKAIISISSARGNLQVTSAEMKAGEGRSSLQHFLEEIGATVEPYPPIEVQIDSDLPWRRAMFKGAAIRTMSYALSALLVGVTVYGMVNNDRGILLAVLQVLRHSALALVAWSLGKVAWLSSDVRGRGESEGRGDEGHRRGPTVRTRRSI